MKFKILKKLFVVTVVLLTAFYLLSFQKDTEKAVPPELRTGFESITGTDGLSYIEFLSCDELEGRDTADRGQRLARKYIISFYKLWGILPAGDPSRGGRSYEQRIRVDIFEKGPEINIEVKKGAVSKEFFHGFDVFSGTLLTPGEIVAPVVFIGYGIHAPQLGYDDFKGVELEGKIALMFADFPGSDNKDSPFINPENRELYGSFSRRIEEIEKRKAAALALIVPGDMSKSTLYKYESGGRIYPPRKRMMAPSLPPENNLLYFVVTENVANYVFQEKNSDWKTVKEGIDSNLKPQSMEFQAISMTVDMRAELRADTTANLLGKIEGSDPDLKDETVLICAHLDHFGMTEDRRVFNGADDNASGSAAVMELAQAFALGAVKPKRAVIFAHWTGEERGLIGSRYFTEFPTVPLKNIVACLNLDMIGREFTIANMERWKRRFGRVEGMEEIDEGNIDRLVMATASFETPGLIDIIKSTSRDYLGLICPVRASTSQSGSNEMYFYRNKIPSVHFSAALHEDYHTAVDTVDKISGRKFEQISRLTYIVANALANGEKRLVWDDKHGKTR